MRISIIIRVLAISLLTVGLLTACGEKQTIGAGLGAVGGGFAGRAIGGSTAGTIVGAGAGAVLGSHIGKSMDDQ